MAFVTTFNCTVCEQPRHEAIHRSYMRVCAACRKAEADQKRRVHFAGLKGLTLEERVERIEQELYDTDTKARLDALDAKTATY